MLIRCLKCKEYTNPKTGTKLVFIKYQTGKLAITEECGKCGSDKFRYISAVDYTKLGKLNTVPRAEKPRRYKKKRKKKSE